MYQNVLVFLGWQGLTLSGLALGMFLMSRKWGCPSCCKKELIMDKHNDMEFAHFDIDWQKRGWEIILITLMSVIPYKVLDLETRILEAEWLLIPYILLFLGTIPVFGILGDTHGLQTSCSLHSKWPWQSIVAYSLAGLLFLGTLAWNLYGLFSESIEQGVSFLIYLIYYVMVLTALYFIAKKFDRDVTLHIHHWICGALGVSMCVYPSIFSNLLLCIYYGVIIEEFAFFGILNLYSD